MMRIDIGRDYISELEHEHGQTRGPHLSRDWASKVNSVQENGVGFNDTSGT